MTNHRVGGASSPSLLGYHVKCTFLESTPWLKYLKIGYCHIGFIFLEGLSYRSSSLVCYNQKVLSSTITDSFFMVSMSANITVDQDVLVPCLLCCNFFI